MPPRQPFEPRQAILKSLQENPVVMGGRFGRVIAAIDKFVRVNISARDPPAQLQDPMQRNQGR
jgi:hypothetical protein